MPCEVQWPAPLAVAMDSMVVFQHMAEFAGLATPVAGRWLADGMFWQAPVGRPGRVVTCSLHCEKAVLGTYALDVPEEDFDRASDGLGTAVAAGNSLVLEVGVAVRMASAVSGSPLLAGIGVVVSKATVVGDMAAVVVSYLGVNHGACSASREEVRFVVVDSYQEAEAALVLARKMPCSPH